MALNFLLSSSMNVSGRLIRHPDQAGFCSFNGFMTQVFVVQTDYWVLTIALCTYFILADFRRLSCYVQNQRWLLMALPWVFSIVWASLGLVLAGYGDIGACRPRPPLPPSCPTHTMLTDPDFYRVLVHVR